MKGTMGVKEDREELAEFERRRAALMAKVAFASRTFLAYKRQAAGMDRLRVPPA
jgi:hypothetical protein